jgi:hypothetical protein
MTIQWQGKRYYRQDGDEIRPCLWHERGAIRCESIREVKQRFGLRWANVMDWTLVK